ncbi:MAG TPA: S8 family serine peptidase [Pyrinomonadaceae bacterium]|nr:S8 family serine peptidase [Pyrinomonadaceae bacterium]
MTTTTTTRREAPAHEHEHARNRFTVIPTPERLRADPTRTGRGVTVAFLDSGFYPHPDLVEPRSRLLAFKDISGEESSLDPSRTPEAWHWHGTMVAVAAVGNGHLSGGVYRGLAPDADVVLVKASAGGGVAEDSIARGIEWVVENREKYRIRVLNISLGGDSDLPYALSDVDLAAERAVAAGIVVVAAAGNSGCGERPHSLPPANSPSVITVGGYSDGNRLDAGGFDLYCSNYGATADGTVKPELIAPAMYVAAPILPNTPAYRAAEALSRLAHAPDYMFRGLLAGLWREAELPESVLDAELEVARARVESLLRERKIVATHYQHADGTSFAAPVVSSVAAQMLEANPRLTPAAVKQILVSTARRVAGAPLLRQGYGVLDARRAVEEATRERHALVPENFGPPRVKGDRLIFFYHDDAASGVALAGDFNDWKASRAALTKTQDGLWRVALDAPPAGRYRYKFVLDGTRWTDDPANGLKEPDGFGGLNSILEIV